MGNKLKINRTETKLLSYYMDLFLFTFATVAQFTSIGPMIFYGTKKMKTKKL